jgi:hypothetical protein
MDAVDASKNTARVLAGNSRRIYAALYGARRFVIEYPTPM